MTLSDHVPTTFGEAIGALRAALGGRVLTAADPGYEAACGVGPASAARPAAIVFAGSTDDIVQAVRFARAQRLSVAVRSRGQRAGAPADEAVLIDASAIDSVTIDPDCCTATVGAGATWSDVAALSACHGLAPVLGEWTQRSAVSDTLSGGMGWLARRHGLASDSVVSFELVTPDGLIVDVTADTHPELFWALSGAGDGSLGVVAAIEIELHSLGTVYAGVLTYPVECATDVLARWRTWVTGARPELTSSVVLAADTVAVHGCWSGAIDVGRALVDVWRQWRTPEADTWEARSIADLDAVTDRRLSPSTTTMTNEWANALRDELLDELLTVAAAVDGSGAGVVEIRLVGGAARARSGAAANGRGRRDQFLLTLAELDADPDHLQRRLSAWVTGAVFLDRADAAERAARTQAAFGSEQWERLCAVKAALDPGNRFRHGLLIERRPSDRPND